MKIKNRKLLIKLYQIHCVYFSDPHNIVGEKNMHKHKNQHNTRVLSLRSVVQT